GEDDVAGVIAEPADLEGAGAADEGVVAHGGDVRRGEVLAPAAGRRLDVEVAARRRTQPAEGARGDVQGSAAGGRVQPLVAAVDDEIDRRPVDVEGDGAELLDGVHQEENAAAPGQLAEGGEVAAEAVVPLHAAEEDEPRPAVDGPRVVLDEQP